MPLTRCSIAGGQQLGAFSNNQYAHKPTDYWTLLENNRPQKKPCGFKIKCNARIDQKTVCNCMIAVNYVLHLMYYSDTCATQSARRIVRVNIELFQRTVRQHNAPLAHFNVTRAIIELVVCCLCCFFLTYLCRIYIHTYRVIQTCASCAPNACSMTNERLRRI